MSVKSMHTALMEMAQNQLDEAVKYTHVLVDKDNKVVAAADSEKGVKQSLSTAHFPPMSIKDKSTLKIVKLKKPASEKKMDTMMLRKLDEERAAWVPESIADEQVEAFMEAALAAVQEGKDTFVFEAKHYKAKTKKEDKLDPVGKADADIDNDGDVDSSDEYLHKRRKAIKKAMDEALDAKDTDTVKAVIKGLKGASKAHAGQAKQLKKDLEDSKVYEKVEIGGTTYQHMDLCPAAVKQFKSDLEKGDNPKVRAAMKAVDAYHGVEAAAKEKGGATQTDVDKMEAMIATAKEKISDAGLSGHDYHQAHLDTVKDMMSKEKMDEAKAPGATAQHGPNDATADTFDKQMGNGSGSIPDGKKKDFVDQHKAEVALDAEEEYMKNKREAENALKRTPPRLGDQRTGDTSFVNPIKGEIIDGITKALQQMKTNN